MDFSFFVARRHSKEEQGSRVAARPTLLTARPHFPFCPRTTSSSLSSSSSLFFFPHNDYPKISLFFFLHHDYQGQSLLHCRHHHQYCLYRHLTDSPSLSSISTKKHGLISHSFEDSLRAIEVVFVLGMYTHLSPLSIVLLYDNQQHST